MFKTFFDDRRRGAQAPCIDKLSLTHRIFFAKEGGEEGGAPLCEERGTSTLRRLKVFLKISEVFLMSGVGAPGTQLDASVDSFKSKTYSQ